MNRAVDSSIATPPEAFDSPLPQGMRDMLPPKAVRQARVGGRLMRSFELFGYGRVWLPLFEYERVLSRAAAETARASGAGTLRFVEPESGEIVALRSDMTPQIARVVSTRYRTAPRPVRLCYQGSVLRRRRERARTESQVVQAGAELVGSAGPAGDLEVLNVMLRAVERTGLAEFVLDVGHAGVAAALLEPVPSAARPLLLEALNAKDRAALQRSVTALGLTRGEHLALAALTELQGEVCKDGVAFWRRAEAALGATAAAPYVNLLRTLVEGAAEAGLAPEIVVDLGEVRGYEYYSGVMFQVLAHGPGEPIASGGRYDTLYDRFGLPNTPAAGFAIDVHNLCWALEQGNVPDPGYPRLVAAGTLPDALLGQLRDLGVVCCGCETETDVAAYAEAYQFEFILSRTGDGLSVKHNRGEVVTVPDAGDAAQKVYEFVARVTEQRIAEPRRV